MNWQLGNGRSGCRRKYIQWFSLYWLWFRYCFPRAFVELLLVYVIEVLLI